MQDITIKAIKLVETKGGFALSVTSTENDGRGDKPSGTKTHTAIVHPDLFQAIQNLGGHYAVEVDVIDELELTEPTAVTTTKLEKVWVSGYSIGGSEKNPGVTLTGHYKNFRGLAVIANTPFLAFTKCSQHLKNQLEIIDVRVRKYLSGEERGTYVAPPTATEEVDPNQLKIPLDDKGQAAGNTYPNGPGSASPEAMKRVAADNGEEKPKDKKKNKQTAANPSGQGGEA